MTELKQLIAEALAKTDVAELVSQTYALEEAGGHYFRGIEHDSLVVDTEHQRWYFNSRGTSGDAIDWLTKQRNMTFREALDQLLGYATGNREANREVLRPIVKPPRNMALDADSYHQVLLSSKSTVATLQRQRNLRLTTVLAAKLGWHPEMKGWTIPHWRHGNTDYCSGIKVRLARGKLRYASVAGSKFELYMPPPLPNLREDMLHIVEGEWKTLSLMQLGTYAVGCPAGAFKKEWAQQLSKFGQLVFVWRDNDLGGLEFVTQVREAMPHAVPLAPPTEWKGVDDFVIAANIQDIATLITEGLKYV